MNARLRDYRVLWRAAVTQANPRLSAVIRWGLPFLVVLIGAALWFGKGPRAALVWVWCAACAAVLLTWTWRFIPGAVKLNSPANAKLVPGMRRRLIELACLVWFAGIAGIAGLALAPYADPGSLGLWLCWIVLGTVGSAFGIAGHQAGGVLLTTVLFGSVFVGELPASVHETLSRPWGVALALLLYAGAIVAAVRAMLPAGGERHWRMIARRGRFANAPGKPDPLLDQLAGARTRGWYAASLRRAGTRRDSQRLMLHALGPSHHVGELLAGLALLSSVLVVLAIFATWQADGDMVKDIGWIFTCMLLAVPFSTTLRLNGMAGAYPGEQALVRLAPAMPGAAPSFNRHLGRALLVHALKGWALSSGAALLLAALGGAGLSNLVRLASVCCLLLPLVAAPLRNHAKRAPMSTFMPVLMLVASLLASMNIGLAARAVAGTSVMPVAALVSIAFAAWIITRGLRVMESAPFAFPAGRMD